MTYRNFTAKEEADGQRRAQCLNWKAMHAYLESGYNLAYSSGIYYIYIGNNEIVKVYDNFSDVEEFFDDLYDQESEVLK